MLRKGEILSKRLAPKLMPKFEGPYRIIKVLGPVNYTIKEIYGDRTQNVLVDRLKPANNVRFRNEEEEEVPLQENEDNQNEPVNDEYVDIDYLRGPDANEENETEDENDDDDYEDSLNEVSDSESTEEDSLEENEENGEQQNENTSNSESLEEDSLEENDENHAPVDENRTLTRSIGPALEYPWIYEGRV